MRGLNLNQAAWEGAGSDNCCWCGGGSAERGELA